MLKEFSMFTIATTLTAARITYSTENTMPQSMVTTGKTKPCPLRNVLLTPNISIWNRIQKGSSSTSAKERKVSLQLKIICSKHSHKNNFL